MLNASFKCVITPPKMIFSFCVLVRKLTARVVEEKGMAPAVLDMKVCDQMNEGCLWSGELQHLNKLFSSRRGAVDNRGVSVHYKEGEM